MTINIVQAAATTGAAIVALFASQRGARTQRQATASEGRRAVALDIARWAQSAETTIVAYHDPENWRVPPGMQFADGQERTGQVQPPSAGHVGPVVAEAATRFDDIKGSARLAFGPDHEVTRLVDESIVAIRLLSQYGVIGEHGRCEPEHYVTLTFQPLVRDLIEELGAASGLREQRSAQSGAKSPQHVPGSPLPDESLRL